MKHSSIEVGAQIDVAAPELRTIESMLEHMQNNPAPAVDQTTPKPFLPTIPAEQYAQIKAKLQAGGLLLEKAMEGQPEAQALVENLTVAPNFQGAVNVDGLQPPDTHGAIGLDHFVEVTNTHVDIFTRAGSLARTISLASFFGYTTRQLFDPRAVYDSTWNRWIITADARPETTTVQYFFIAISTTSNPLGSYFIYRLNVTFTANDFWDYPQLGFDQDAVIFTANIFASGGTGPFKFADMFAVAKARLYNGFGFSVPIFTGLRGTLAPPVVLDQNFRTFLIAASGGSVLSLYTLTNSSKPNGIALTGPVNITVPAYSAPPDAPQPGTSVLLDTLDGRFVNASTQSGNFLWQVHTVSLGSFAAPKFYQINIATNAVVQSAFFYGTSTSFDFNASIVANGVNDAWVTWTLTDPPRGTNAQVRCATGDHLVGSTYNFIPGTAVFTSPSYYGGGRWGDYSAVTLDPRDSRNAFLVNEDILANHNWATRIAGVHI